VRAVPAGASHEFTALCRIGVTVPEHLRAPECALRATKISCASRRRNQNAERMTMAHTPTIDDPTHPAEQFHIVGIGASAGGLEALEALFAVMPERTGMAFVVLQHLSPDFESRMDELLARRTRIAIRKVTDGVEVEPDHIYLIPPAKDMILSGGRLLLTDKDPARGLTLPIDHFLRSLAQDAGRNAIAVILSGTGSDGSRGIKEVHDAGGLVIAQDPATARFDGMPRSAIETGVVEVELAPAAIPDALVRFVRSSAGGWSDRPHPPVADSPMAQILELLRAEYGIDFAHYKPNTVIRRIERRLTMARLDDVESYAARLCEDSAELNALYFDLLIGVTRFFRDPDAFEHLEREIIPGLVQSSPDLRIWVPGCATGEEVYSYAILIHEIMSRMGRRPRAKIFATDVHPESLELASNGVFDAEALLNVSATRRERYFVPAGEKYRITKELRELVVFARHNVISDAPFTKLDLVSCRNLLIYFQPAAQKKALSLFHFGLKTGGILVLGPSETPGELRDEFEPIQGRWKIYRKRRDIRLPADMRLTVSSSGTMAPKTRVVAGGRRLADGVLLAAYDQLLTRHVPPAFLVDEHYELLHSFAGAEGVLQFRGGRATTNLLDLLPDTLRAPLAGALQQAAKQRETIRYTGVDANAGGEEARYCITVQPLPEARLDTVNFLVELERIAQGTRVQPVEVDAGQVSRDYVAELEGELRFTRENLQATIEELETSNEELQATNEEMVAANEELQSTNEELHSVNEELHTVNVEHQRKIDELTELTDDMENLLASTDIGVLFLDKTLNVRRFTPRIASLFHLLPQDVGRSFESFSHELECPSLLADIQTVMARGTRIERDVQSTDGKLHFLRILPYRTKHDASGGVLLTIVDISSLKHAEAEARRLSAVVRSARDAIIAKDLQGRITSWNPGAEELYGYTEVEALGMDVRVLVPEHCRQEEADLIESVASSKELPTFETQRIHKSGARVDVELTVSPVQDALGKVIGASTIARDISSRKRAEAQVQMTIAQREQFLALLSHELRNPLMGLANATRVLSEQALSNEAKLAACDVVRRQVQQMARLLEDLLDSSRMRRDRIELHRERVDLRATVESVMDTARPQAEEAGVEVAVSVPDHEIPVDADVGRLQQLQANLLTNAIRYSPRGAHVRYMLTADQECARIVVEDDGEGITRDNLPHIFEPFFQGVGVRRRPGHKGMGLGLSLARSIAMAHGGEISAHSDGPGKGTRFEVRLPLAVSDEASDAARAEEPSTRLVLLVDDDVDSRELLGILLEHAGHDVIQAGTAREGIELLLERRPRAAIVDIGLPDMSGLEVARRVRDHLGQDGVTLIALTGFGQQKDRDAAAAAGFDHHLVKPLDFETIETMLRVDE
jgi:two-component system CheB/CheR fusion protein